MFWRDRVVVAAVAVALAWAGASCATSHPTAGHHGAQATTTSKGPSRAATLRLGPPTSPATAVPATTVPPTTVPPPPTTTTKPPVAVVPGAGIAVGDSVLEDVQLYAPATLTSHQIAINAAVGRQWAVGVSILTSLRAHGKLPPVVVVGLGSNGRVTDAQFDQMMQACAGAKRVVFMTVTGPLIGNNPVITAGVARYPQAALADWNALAAAHADWFAPDHVHVGPAGAAALGNLLASVS